MKKHKTPKKQELYMTYHTYSFLRALLELELATEFKKYDDARGLIGKLEIKEDRAGFPLTHTCDPYFKDKRASDQIWNSYKVRCQHIENMKAQLDFAYSKSAHPNMIAEKGFFE